MPCGHINNGKAGYQQPAITLVKNGLAVFCFDPIGQDERRQVGNKFVTEALAGKSGDGLGTTTEHTVLNRAPILLGRSLATYMIWDGIRAIDYLETRQDLDARRLGCTGIPATA